MTKKACIQYKQLNNIDGSSQVTFNGKTSFDSIASIEGKKASFDDLEISTLNSENAWTNDLTAQVITSDTIAATEINVNTLTATKEINTDAIAANTVTALSLSVTNSTGVNSGFVASDSMTSDIIYILPSSTGLTTQILTQEPTDSATLNVLSTDNGANADGTVAVLAADNLSNGTQLYWDKIVITPPATSEVQLSWQTRPLQVTAVIPPLNVEESSIPIPVYWKSTVQTGAITIDGQLANLNGNSATSSAIGVGQSSGQITGTPVEINSSTGDIVTPGFISARNIVLGPQLVGSSNANGSSGVVILSSAVTSSSHIFLTRNIADEEVGAIITSLGSLVVGAIIAGESFTVYSTVANDHWNFHWLIINS